MTNTVFPASWQNLHVSMQMVHEDDELYSVTEMASLLFGNEEPPSCYASHRLLSQERIFFKQAGRSPPRFQARSAKEVHSLKAKRIADEKVAPDSMHTALTICMYPCVKNADDMPRMCTSMQGKALMQVSCIAQQNLTVFITQRDCFVSCLAVNRQ
jgi:hypothetical protein